MSPKALMRMVRYMVRLPKNASSPTSASNPETDHALGGHPALFQAEQAAHFGSSTPEEQKNLLRTSRY
jgi:hypothetical protein